MAQSQLDEKAQRILNVAFQLAEEGGFEAVRLRDVAERADVALGTLYNRFSSKEDMLVTALDESTKTFEGVIADLDLTQGSPANRVGDLLVLAARALFNRPNFGRAVLRAAAVGGGETTSRIYNHQQTITRLILACMRSDGTDGASDEELKTCRWLQQISFACLVGWANGMLSEDEVVDDLQAAARRLVGASS